MGSPRPTPSCDRCTRRCQGDFRKPRSRSTTPPSWPTSPEAVNRWRLRRQRLDSLLDYVRTGKESYFIVSEFNLYEYKDAAPLFKKMSDQFELCVFGLNLVKRNLEQMQQESYVRAQKYLV